MMKAMVEAMVDLTWRKCKMIDDDQCAKLRRMVEIWRTST
jgi:hypothetical protein